MNCLDNASQLGSYNCNVSHHLPNVSSYCIVLAPEHLLYNWLHILLWRN